MYAPFIYLPLELNKILSTSHDWDELLWAWTGWRNVSGRLMLEDYAKHVQYPNKQAVLSGGTLFDNSGTAALYSTI